MRILWLYKNEPKGDIKGIARRIHWDFIMKLPKQYPNVKLLVYGPKNPVDKELSPLPFSRKLLFRDVRKKLKPDVVFMYSRFNCFDRSCWLPGGFRDASIPKVILECDYWNILPRQRQWYKENHITLMLQRGPYPKTVTPSIWLPWSASEAFVQHQEVKLKDRMHKIGFCGRGGTGDWTKSYYYPLRRHAVHILHMRDLIKCKGKVGHHPYVKWMGKFFSYLADGGKDKMPKAKHTEIVASGSLLFSTPLIGWDRLFEDAKKPFYVEWDYDLNNIVEQARKTMEADIGWCQAVADRATEVVNRYHLDHHRIKELYTIISTYLNTGRLIKRWGI